MSVPGPSKQYTFTYTSDDGNTYSVQASQSDATMGTLGTGHADNPYFGTRKGKQKMRMIHGVSDDGTQHVSVPCGTLAAAMTLFFGGSFTDPHTGTSYTPTGYTGERRSRGKLGG